MERKYETDLSDEQWELIGPLVEAPVGRKANVSRRDVVNAILYVVVCGTHRMPVAFAAVCCPWIFLIGALSIRATTAGPGMAPWRRSILPCALRCEKPKVKRHNLQRQS